MSDKLFVERVSLAQHISNAFAEFPEVEAVALGGSTASGYANLGSDIDLYVYITREIPVTTRSHFIYPRSSQIELDNRVSEPSDTWVEAASGIAVDLMYRHPAWIEERLTRVLHHHEASVGYSTAFWHNVRHSMPLFDRTGWFGRLQEQAVQPYPEELIQAIVAKNHPILRDAIFSWLHQLEAAVQSNDLILVNQKSAKLLASYFDIVFAVNHMTHPGEKRLLKWAGACEKTPPQMAKQVLALLQSACSPDDQILLHANELLNDLDQLLFTEGYLQTPVRN